MRKRLVLALVALMMLLALALGPVAPGMTAQVAEPYDQLAINGVCVFDGGGSNG